MTACTLAEFRQRRSTGATTWMVCYQPFIGTPLDNGKRGGVEEFYADDAEALDVYAERCASGDVDAAELHEWRHDGEWWHRTPLEAWEAPPPFAVAVFGAVSWWGTPADGFDAQWSGLSVAQVRYAEAGEAEGGLVALARLLAGSRGVSLGEPSPAGWYWNAAIRGVWTGPQLAASAFEAMRAASAHLATHDTRIAADEATQ